VITNWNSYVGDSDNPDLIFLLGNGDGTFTDIEPSSRATITG
jgi:hypothetical protein